MKSNSYDKDAIADLIDRTSWANDLTWHQIKELSHYFRACQAAPGEWLLREGEPGNFMGLIVEGEIEVIKESGHGLKKLALLRPSQTFGELSLIDGEKCSASVRVKSAALVLITNKEQLFRLAENNPLLGFNILWKITQLLSRRLRMTSGTLIDYL